MNKEKRNKFTPAVSRSAFLLAALFLSPRTGQAQSDLQLKFDTPATNAAPNATFSGRLEFTPPEMELSATVTQGAEIVPLATMSNTATEAWVMLEPLTNASGWVRAEVTGISGGETNTVAFEVWFQPYPVIELLFDTPVTNAAPGATFEGMLAFSPTNMPLIARIVSGADIVPAIHLSPTNDLTQALVVMAPVTNKSGWVSAEVEGSSGGVTNIVEFDVWYRRYPPVLSAIPSRTMDEDGTNTVAFTVTYPDRDTDETTLDFSLESDNEALIAESGMTVSGNGEDYTLTLIPKADINGEAEITLRVSDAEYTVSRSFALTVDPVPDPPTISGAVDLTIRDDANTTNILSGVVIADVDHDMPDPETLSVTVTLDSDVYAEFGNDSDTFSTSGSPSEVTDALRALELRPKRFTAAPGTLNAVAVEIEVRDGVFPAVEETAGLTIEVINTPPDFGIILDPNSVVEGQSIQPFHLDYVNDPDKGGEGYTLHIDFADPGQAFLGHIAPTNELTDNITGLQAEIRNLVFQAAPGVLTNPSQQVELRFGLTDWHGGEGVLTNALTLLQQQTPPQIFGIPEATLTITDGDPPFAPLPDVYVLDPDQAGEQPVRALLSLSNPALGSLSATNFALRLPSQLTAALRSVIFTPTPDVLPENESGDTTLRVTVYDETELSTQNNNLTIRVKSVNNAPRLLNIPAPEQQPVLIPPLDPVRPFAHVGLYNDDTNSVFVSVTIDDPGKGVLGNLGGFVEDPPGHVEMTGKIPAILASLTNITYTLDGGYLFPPDDPGGTVFTLLARDFALLTSTRSLAIQVQDEPRNHLVVRAANDGLPGSFNHALAHAGNNDTITFALPEYPARIRMPGTVPDTLIRNLTIKGPGANLLTLSGDNNGDSLPDRQIFRIEANVTIEGVTLSHGTASAGGAILVRPDGALTLRQCAVVDSTATEYGGAIDVDGGALTLEQCFIGRNRLSPDSGISGAGVSVYSDQDIHIINTTFAENVQPNETGDGGGALVVENLSDGLSLDCTLVHCTFAGNVDASGRASAVLGIGAGTRIRPLNSIFADFSGRNLNVAAADGFLSGGGNLCDDSSQTTLLQGEGGTVYLLDASSDETEIDPRLDSLDPDADPTPCHGLLAGSPAIDKGIGTELGLDQRGVMRQGIPDAGAVEFDALRRLVLNEIHHDDAGVNFIELYVRRDATAVDLAGYSLFIDGVAVHDFSSGRIIGTNAVFAAGDPAPTRIEPGFGMVVAFCDSPLMLTGLYNPTPVVMPSRPEGMLDLETRGVVTVARDIGVESVSERIARQSWLGDFLDPATGTNLLDTAGNSLSLAPQFLGFALVPHGLIRPGPFGGIDAGGTPAPGSSSPGADAGGTPFGQDNAEPLAREDILTVFADRISPLDVLDNDFDSDGNDRLVIVDLSRDSEPGTGDVPAINSALDATVSVVPAATPLRGESLLYDPRLSYVLRSLTGDEEIIDTFHYEIIDVGSAPVASYADGGASTTVVVSVNHRLRNAQRVTISGASRPAYNGAFSVTVLDGDRFAIPVAYAGPAEEPGSWETELPRLPTSRSEAAVSVRVLGVNDPPTAVADVITNVTEITRMRVMTRPELAGTELVFPEDSEPPPEMSEQDLLSNDLDVDADDTWESLRVRGVMASVHPIAGYSGTPGEEPVTVHAPSHGRISGDEVLIANYGGSVAYNGYHAITVLDEDRFSIQRHYVDDHAVKGYWGILNESNRYLAITDVGAEVRLTLRSNPLEDFLVYDASASAFLKGLAQNELYTNRFWVAVEDSHGAVGIGPVDVVVQGLNDTPLANPNPDSLDRLDPLVTVSNTLDEVLSGGLDLMYVRPSSSGKSGQVNLYVQDLSGSLAGTIELENFFATDEDTPLDITALELLVNNSDIDRRDVLEVVGVDPFSREQARVSLSGGILTYNPTNSVPLQALAREEMRIDSFEVVVSDGWPDGVVTSRVAVLVTGVNDTPRAAPDVLTTHEDEVLVFDPRLNDVEIDIDGIVPDDRLRIVPVADLPNPGDALVTLWPTSGWHDATVSDRLNQLADWQSFTNVFEYTITDNSFLFAVDDEFHVPADSAERRLDVLANDRDFTDATGSPVIIDAGPTLRGGSLAIVSNGQYLAYSPPAGFFGEDVFRYTIQNNQGDVNSARGVVRSVIPVQNGILPTAADHYSVAAGETAILDVLANDHERPRSGAELTLAGLVSSSVPGQPVLQGNTFVYTATNGLESLSFTYAVTAGGSATGRADAVVQVVDRRGTLDIRDDAFSVPPGSFDNPLDVLANDGLVTESTDNLRIREILQTATHGSLARNESQTALVYTPDPGFIGIERIAYLASDQIGGTGTGRVEIAVGRVETVADFFKLEAAATDTVLLDVLVNDRMMPAARGSLTLLGVSPAGGASGIGTLATHAAGDRLVFDASGGIGEQAWNYMVADASTGSPRTATGRVSIVTVESGTYANPDQFRVRAGGSGYVLDVLANDKSYPAQNKSYSIVALGTGADAPDAGGTVAVVDNMLRYTPAPGFAGEESFTYTMSDSTGTDVARVTVEVRRGDLNANDDHYSVYYEWEEDAAAPREFRLPVVLNDRIQPALDMTFSVTSLGAGVNLPDQGGSVEIASGGQELIYRPGPEPAPEYTERFTYEITDEFGRSAAAIVRVRVTQREDNLEAITQDDAFSVARNSINNPLDVLENDFVKPGSAAGWSITAVSDSSLHGGSVTIDGAGLLYSPTNDFVGVDQFSYSVSDGLGGTGSATVSVRVGSLPTLLSRFAVLSGSVTNHLDVLANDALSADYAGEYELAGVAGPTKGGSVVLGGSDTVLYSPDPGFPGAYPYREEFEYTVIDDSGVPFAGRAEVTVYDRGSDRDTAEITLTVEGRNDPPEIINVSSNAPITDKETGRPFTGVTIIEVDEQLQERIDVQVAIDDPARGVLTNLNGFVDLGGGVYALSNVTAQVSTQSIRQLVYVPVENRITVPTTERVLFTITVTDNKSPAVVDTQSFLDVIAVNDPPWIEGTRPDQRFYFQLPIRPFAEVLLHEVDDLTLQPLAVTITLVEPDHGLLLNTGDFVDQGSGVYRATNLNAAAATAQLREIEFSGVDTYVPLGESLTTHLHLAVDDGFAPAVTDTVTRVTAMHPYEGEVQPDATDLRSEFGLAVAARVDFSVVGAPGASRNGENAGAAFVYRRDSSVPDAWSEWRMLLPGTVQAQDRFGRSVGMDGSLIAVGAPAQTVEGVPSGSVYVFERDMGGLDNWGEWIRLTPTNLPGASRFGQSVALHGDLLAVGAPDADLSGDGTHAGAVFLFGRHQGGLNAWGEILRWAPNDPAYAGADVGWSVSVSDETLAAGAPRYNAVPSSSAREGAVVQFYRHAGGSNRWGRVTTIETGESAASLDFNFGWDVAVSGSRLAVGAYRMTAGAVAQAGRVTLYEKASPDAPFLETDRLDQRNDSERWFGYSLALSDDLLFVGAPYNPEDSSVSGAAFLYRCGGPSDPGWHLTKKYMRRFDSLAALYGSAVDLGEGTAIVGAPKTASSPPRNEGFAFMYRFGFEVLDDETRELTIRQLWDRKYFGDALNDPSLETTIWGEFADPDNDGLVNSQKYAFGGEPGITGEEGILRLRYDPDGNLVFEYERRCDDPDLVFTLEASFDMLDWFDLADILTAPLDERLVPLSDSLETVILSAGMPEGFPRLFFRITVE